MVENTGCLDYKSIGLATQEDELMLILSRKVGERIKISDGIEILVAAIQGNRIKLAFAAPANISILRAELPCQQRATTNAAGFLGEPANACDLHVVGS